MYTLTEEFVTGGFMYEITNSISQLIQGQL